jgi:hypothetical protein
MQVASELYSTPLYSGNKSRQQRLNRKDGPHIRLDSGEEKICSLCHDTNYSSVNQPIAY